MSRPRGDRLRGRAGPSHVDRGACFPLALPPAPMPRDTRRARIVGALSRRVPRESSEGVGISDTAAHRTCAKAPLRLYPDARTGPAELREQARPTGASETDGNPSLSGGKSTSEEQIAEARFETAMPPPWCDRASPHLLPHQEPGAVLAHRVAQGLGDLPVREAEHLFPRVDDRHGGARYDVDPSTPRVTARAERQQEASVHGIG